MKIVVMAPFEEKEKELFAECCEKKAELVWIDSEKRGATAAALWYESGKKELREQLADADAVIGNPDVNDLIDAKKLKWVQSTNAGVERYTENPLFPSGVILTNMTGAFGGTISEYILAGILALYRQLPAYQVQQQKQSWKNIGTEMGLMGKKALILGAGNIGEQTAKKLKAFGVSVTGIRRVVRQKPENFDEMVGMEALEDRLSEADLVIGCLPKTKETVHILDERRLRFMKKDAVLVNVGRGSLIVTDDLVKVLREGHLYGAVLDVTEPEPLPKGHPLWDIDRVILTPHVSGISFGHRNGVEKEIAAICRENLERFFQGKQLKNQVDFSIGYADYAYRENR